MKYKALKSAVHNLGRFFASSLNWRDNDYVMSHLARAVVTSGEVELDVDLLSGSERAGAELRDPARHQGRWTP